MHSNAWGAVLFLIGSPLPVIGQAQQASSSEQKAAHARVVSGSAEPAWLRRSLPLVAGRVQRGTLSNSDSTLDDGSRYQVWRYRAQRGERLEVHVSAKFDAAVFVVRFAPSGEPDVLAESGDASGPDVRLVLRAPAAEELTVVVSAVLPAPAGEGGYSLEASATPPVRWASVYPGGGSPRGKYALIVGISDYPGEGNDLVGPVEDTKRVADLLVQRFGFPKQNVVVLTDSLATRERIAQAFTRHLGQAGPEGIAVFYFSGHGLQLPNEGLGPDIDPEPDGRDEAIYVWDALGFGTALIDDELGALVQRLHTRRSLIILDACYSGTATRAATFRPKRVTSRDVARYYRSAKALHSPPILDSLAAANPEDEDTPDTHVLLAASRSDQVSFADSRLPEDAGAGSLFTWLLVKALRTASPQTSIQDLMAPVIVSSKELSVALYQTLQSPQAEGTRLTSPIREFLGDTVGTGTAKGTLPYRKRPKKP